MPPLPPLHVLEAYLGRDRFGRCRGRDVSELRERQLGGLLGLLALGGGLLGLGLLGLDARRIELLIPHPPSERTSVH